MPFCSHCNLLLKPGAHFCHKCGAQYIEAYVTPTPQSPPPVNMLELPSNRKQTYAIIWLCLTLAFLACILLPFIADIDMMNGGGAMIFIGFIMFITGAIVTPFYFKLAKKFSNIVSGKNILAYWIYDAAEWGEYAEGELRKRKKEKWAMFWFITLIGIVVNIILCIAKPAGLFFFVIEQFVLMAIIGITAYLSYSLPHQKNVRNMGRAIIAPNGVYLNGSFHSWQGLSARFESVRLTDNDTILQFTYSALVRYGQRENYTVNVPIPRNQLSTAFKIISFFNEHNGMKNNH